MAILLHEILNAKCYNLYRWEIGCCVAWRVFCMFQSGDYVIYGIHGVCRVIGKEKQLVNRKRTEYLVLEPLGQVESR